MKSAGDIGNSGLRDRQGAEPALHPRNQAATSSLDAVGGSI